MARSRDNHDPTIRAAVRDEYNEHYSSADFSRWAATDSGSIERLTRRLRIVTRSERRGGAALDIGCGGGHITNALNAYYRTTGIDYSEKAIECARAAFPNLTLAVMDANDLQIDESFDLILCRSCSLCNTYDIKYMANLFKKYVAALCKGGALVFGFSTDYSGKDMNGGNARHTRAQLQELMANVGTPADGPIWGLESGKLPDAVFRVRLLRVLIGKLIEWRMRLLRTRQFYYIVFFNPER